MSDERKGDLTKISRRDAFEMLPMDKPVTLSVEQQASLRALINKMDSIANDLASQLEARTVTYG